MPVPIGYITYTIYPKNAIFTASYIDTSQTYTFSFTNEDCTIVDDHLFYRSGEVNKAGTTTIVAYGVTQTISTADGDSDPIININVPKPSNLYAYTDPNVSGETLYAWTIDPEDIESLFSSRFPFSYIKDGQSFTLPDNTIYTKTPVVDTSTNVYYLVDDTELAITNIHFAYDDPYDSDGIVSADASTITIEFSR